MTKVNIYYGGRGLIEDPTIYVMDKITEVLNELNVVVRRYNLYEDKKGISVLPKTLKEADAVILAASVEWFSYGGLLQQFLDACWLYGDKETIQSLCMMPVVLSTTYGEKEASLQLTKAWELLGGKPCDGIEAYITDPEDFKANDGYTTFVEKRVELFYRTFTGKLETLPSSNSLSPDTLSRPLSIDLTPQESEQLSAYVSDDNYVKKQKEDIEELASLFKDMLGDEEETETDKYIAKLQEHFVPKEGMDASFRLDLTDAGKSLIVDVKGAKLDCYYGTMENPDVIAKVATSVLEQILNGEKPFQNAFMSGDLSAQGNFKALRNFDAVFRFS